MLSVQYINLSTCLVYLPSVSHPVDTPALHSNVCHHHRLRVDFIIACCSEVCAVVSLHLRSPVKPETSLYSSNQRTALLNFILTCHFPFHPVAVNKYLLLFSNPLCESPSVTEDQTDTDDEAGISLN